MLYSSLWCAVEAFAQSCAPGWIRGLAYPGVAGAVWDLMRWDPDGPEGPHPDLVVVGGSFYSLGGERTEFIGAWNPATGEWLPFGEGMGGNTDPRVYALATAPNGDLIAAGNFVRAGTVAANRIARWDGTRWEAMGEGFDRIVHKVVVMPNGDIIAAGEFTRSGTRTVAGVARWDGAQWQPLATSLEVEVLQTAAIHTMKVLDDGSLVVAGRFTGISGVAAHSIARLRNGAWEALDTGLRRNGASSFVRDLQQLPSGELIAGGDFNNAGGVGVQNIAAWDGTGWSAMGSGLHNAFTTGYVWDMCVRANGDLVAVGSFQASGSTPISRIARWNGTSWEEAAAGLTTTATDLVELADGRLLVAHGGTIIDGQSMRGLMTWDGQRWTAADNGLDDEVMSIAVLDDGAVVLGGAFTTAGGVRSLGSIIWDGHSWRAMPWNSEYVTVVRLHKRRSGELIAAATFGAYYTVHAWREGRWVQLGGDAVGRINAIGELADGTLVVGGAFTSIAGVPMNRLAQWTGNTWAPLASPINGEIRAMRSLPDGTLLVGGSFEITVGERTSGLLAYWNGTWGTFGLGPDSHVYGIELLNDGRIAVAGNAAGQIQIWNETSWQPLGYFQQGSGVRLRGVRQLSSGDLLAFGDFWRVDGQLSRYLAVWNGSQWAPPGPELVGYGSFVTGVGDVAQMPNGEVLIGGRFYMAGELPSAFFARYSLTNFPRIAQQPENASVSCRATAAVSVVPATGYDPIRFGWQIEDPTVPDGWRDLADGTLEIAGEVVGRIVGSGAGTLRVTPYIDFGAINVRVVVSNDCGNAVSTVATLRVAACPCPADWDGSGGVDGDDIGAFFADWQGGNADIDRSGGTDGDDITLFFERWQSGC